MHWVTCSFVTMNTGTIVYSESTPHTKSILICYWKWCSANAKCTLSCVIIATNYSARLNKKKKCRITSDLSSKISGKCTKVQTYKHVFSPLKFKFRTPIANSSIFSHSYDGAIMGGADVDDGNTVTQRLHGGWQSESHLFTASCCFLLLFVLL